MLHNIIKALALEAFEVNQPLFVSTVSLKVFLQVTDKIALDRLEILPKVIDRC